MAVPLHLIPPRITPLRAYVPKPARTHKMDANEAPLSPPEGYAEALAARLSRLAFNRYPDPRASELREAISRRYETPAETILLGCGSDEIISLLYLAMSGGNRNSTPPTALFPTPGFVMYEVNALTHGWVPIGCPLAPGWKLDIPAIVDAIQHHEPNIIFQATPNNPTGNIFPDADLRRVIEAAPRSLCVLDEAYGAFSQQDLSAIRRDYGHVATMRTLSKVGLAALRVGWLQAHPDLIHELEKVRQPYNLSVLSQTAASLALTDYGDWLDEQVAQVVRERERLTSNLREMAHLKVYPSDANFILVQCLEGESEIEHRLQESQISVRRFPSIVSLGGHLRISVGTPAENDALLGALSAS